MKRARDYALTFDQRPHYVFVKLRAELIDHVTVLDYLSEIAVTCAKWHTRSLLIERDIPMVLADEEMLDSWGVFLNTRAQMRVAIVNPYPGLGPNLKNLIASADAGAVKAEYFDDIAAAERWIGN